MSSVHNQLLFSSRNRDSVLAHVHLAEFKLLRKVIQSGGADLVPGDGVAGVGRLTAHNAAERRDATLAGLHMSGILFGVAILQMLEVGSTTDGILTAHFQVDFWTAISSAILICILGGLAGLAPAWRAMSIKPVDAMRDE